MSAHRIASFAGTMALVAALGAVAVGASGTAAANATDDAFVAALAKQGITTKDPQAAVRVANNICSDLGAGVSASEIGRQLAADNSDLQATGPAIIISESVHYYCPEYTSRV